MDLKKPGSNFTNEHGKLDVKRLLNASSKILPNFINKRKHKDSESGGNESGTPGYSNSSTAVLEVIAAIAAADQRPHYSPSNSKDAVNALAASAQNALDLSAGLGMTPGRSSFPDHQYPSGINPDYAKKGAKASDHNKKGPEDKP
jgi:hypothetical protein